MLKNMDFSINDNDWEILDKLITNSKLEDVNDEVIIEDFMNFNKMLKNKKKNGSIFNSHCVNCNSLDLVINEKNGYSVC
jgi:transcription initiation factor TFIIIB Brf1 subunit/transcription initiation factor TFIIB